MSNMDWMALSAGYRGDAEAWETYAHKLERELKGLRAEMAARRALTRTLIPELKPNSPYVLKENRQAVFDKLLSDAKAGRLE